MKRIIAVGVLMTCAVSVASQKPKNVYKLTHLSTNTAIFSCQNGADPTFKQLTGDSVLVSCGASVQARFDGKQFICPKGLYVWPDDHIDGKQDVAYCGTYPLK